MTVETLKPEEGFLDKQQDACQGYEQTSNGSSSSDCKEEEEVSITGAEQWEVEQALLFLDFFSHVHLICRAYKPPLMLYRSVLLISDGFLQEVWLFSVKASSFYSFLWILLLLLFQIFNIIPNP
jgi:hypothetical protein